MSVVLIKGCHCVFVDGVLKEQCVSCKTAEGTVEPHTPEPWRVEGSWIAAGDINDPLQPGETLRTRELYGAPMVCESVHRPNAERIVACVNACVGIPTSQLGGMPILEQLNQLFMERDQINDWKDASGLLSGGDPGGVTPEMLREQVLMLDGIAQAAVKLVDTLDATRGKGFQDAARALDEMKVALEPYRKQREE